ncbi:MAG: dipeptidase [Rhodothermales bacterium]|nr:dipeptidase [Rhodothermales bacterium]
MARFRFGLRIAGLVLAAALTLFFLLAPGSVDRRMNRIAESPVGSLEQQPVSEQAAAFHAGLVVADLHANPLLWGRNLGRTYSYGHMDITRMQVSGPALQVFSAVTKVPAGLNYTRNDADSDLVRWLALTQLWPPHTWFSLRNRALYQAAKLDRVAARSDGRLVVVHSVRDLEVFLRRRQAQPGLIGGILAMEGLHALEGDADNLQTLFDAGYRVFGLTHFFDNEVAGSAHGVTQGGLTPFGRDVVAWMERHNGILDLAHLSASAFDEVLALTGRPVIVSHTGVQGTCPGPRNLSDAQIDRIAANGGLIGIGFWEGAVCEPTIDAIVEAIQYAVARAGIDHVALGSDFDGATTVPFDVTGLPWLTEALLKAGFSGAEVGQLMGGNAVRFFLMHLPPGTPGP